MQLMLNKLTDFHLNFQPSGTKKSLVNEVPPVRHANQEDVVQLLHSINLYHHRHTDTHPIINLYQHRHTDTHPIINLYHHRHTDTHPISKTNRTQTITEILATVLLLQNSSDVDGVWFHCSKIILRPPSAL